MNILNDDIWNFIYKSLKYEYNYISEYSNIEFNKNKYNFKIHNNYIFYNPKHIKYKIVLIPYGVKYKNEYFIFRSFKNLFVDLSILYYNLFLVTNNTFYITKYNILKRFINFKNINNI
jgi:hypothetical protein